MATAVLQAVGTSEDFETRSDMDIMVEYLTGTGLEWIYESIDEITVLIAPAHPSFITAKDYPLFAEIWDNDADAVYDDL